MKSPVTFEELGVVECASTEDIAAAMRQARAAQKEWAKKSPAERARIVIRAHDIVLARQDEITATSSLRPASHQPTRWPWKSSPPAM